MVLATTGPRRVQHDASIAAHHNVGKVERWLSVLGGSALTVVGASRRGPTGVLLALMGAELVRRGATGHCFLYDAVGVSTASDSLHHGPHVVRQSGPAASLEARSAVKIERTVTVNRPAHELYAFWRDPKNVPGFMHLIDRVEVIDDRHARWFATGFGGKQLSWEEEIINDVPDQLIAWKSVDGSDVANAGSVHFEQAPGDRGTQVKIVAEYDPPGGRAGQWLAKLLGKSPDAMVREDLRHFKELMESGIVITTEGQPTGRR